MGLKLVELERLRGIHSDFVQGSGFRLIWSVCPREFCSRSARSELRCQRVVQHAPTTELAVRPPPPDTERTQGRTTPPERMPSVPAPPPAPMSSPTTAVKLGVDVGNAKVVDGSATSAVVRLSSESSPGVELDSTTLLVSFASVPTVSFHDSFDDSFDDSFAANDLRAREDDPRGTNVRRTDALARRICSNSLPTCVGVLWGGGELLKKRARFLRCIPFDRKSPKYRQNGQTMCSLWIRAVGCLLLAGKRATCHFLAGHAGHQQASLES